MRTLIDDPTRASRYLADQLSEAECAEYEERMVRDPEMVAELEATARLKIGLERLRRSGELSELLIAPGAAQRRTWMISMAASLAAVAIGVSLWFPHTRETASPLLSPVVSTFTDQNGHALAILSPTVLYRARAEERYDAVIDLPATRSAVQLRVYPTSPAALTPPPRYQAALARVHDDNSAEPAVTIHGLQPSSEGFVDIYADSALLAPGQYRLVLTLEGAGSATDESDTFLVKVNGHR